MQQLHLQRPSIHPSIVRRKRKSRGALIFQKTSTGFFKSAVALRCMGSHARNNAIEFWVSLRLGRESISMPTNVFSGDLQRFFPLDPVSMRRIRYVTFCVWAERRSKQVRPGWTEPSLIKRAHCRKSRTCLFLSFAGSARICKCLRETDFFLWDRDPLPFLLSIFSFFLAMIDLSFPFLPLLLTLNDHLLRNGEWKSGYAFFFFFGARVYFPHV